MFKSGYVKNCVMEFVGPGISSMSTDYRNGIDIMTTETTCLSSIWRTDEDTQSFLSIHGRGDEYKENICVNYAALVGVVADLAVVFAVKFLPGSVGGRRDNRLSRAPFYLGNMKMEQGQLSVLLLVGGAVNQSGNVRQGKDLLHKNKEGPLAHAAHFRDDAFNRRPTGNKTVVSFLPVSLLVILDAVLQPLAFMLVLLHFGLCLGALFLQFLTLLIHRILPPLSEK